MGIPQIIYIILTSISLLLVANKHGQPRGKHNVWLSLIALGITYSLLISGGFFS